MSRSCRYEPRNRKETLPEDRQRRCREIIHYICALFRNNGLKFSPTILSPFFLFPFPLFSVLSLFHNEIQPEGLVSSLSEFGRSPAAKRRDFLVHYSSKIAHPLTRSCCVSSFLQQLLARFLHHLMLFFCIQMLPFVVKND